MGVTPPCCPELDTINSNLNGFLFRRVMTADGAIRYPWISGSVEALLGFKADSMAVNAQGCLHVIHWADRTSHLDEILRSARTLTPAVEEFRAISAQGEVRWLKGASRPARAEDGQVVWDGLVVDVTQGRRAELRLEMLMDHANDSILVLDSDGVVETVNAAAQRLFAYCEGEMTGAALTDLLVTDASIPDLLDAPEATGGLAGGGPRELVGRRTDGSQFPLELSTSEVRLDGQRLFVAIGRDITARRLTEAALHETEQRLRAIAGNMPGMVFQRVLHPDGQLVFTYVSDGCRAVLGLEAEELMDQPDLFLDKLPEDQRLAFLTALGRSAKTMQPMEEELSVVGADGRRRWLRGLSRPTAGEDGRVIWDGVLLDDTGRKNAEQRLSFLAYHDPLTRLPNRAAFLDRFASAKGDAERASGLLAVVSMGIDRFGIINATMGHATGDQVLVAAADAIQAAIGRADMVARASGDRFLLMLTGLGSKREVAEVLERLHQAIQTTVAVGTQEFDISATIGAAIWPRDGEDAETLIMNADAALQRAKAQGPASLQMYTKEMGTRAAKTLSMQSRLRRALDHGELSAHYQPQVELTHGTVIGMEALVRWNSPELGFVSPADFIPVAEECGLIDNVCEFMLELCSRQVKDWQDQGLPAIPVAVNVSGRQFQNARRLISTCERVLAANGLPSRWLELELTESSAMRDADNAIAVVQQLKEMGIACSIDDFGTGYSSLSVLKRFPIQKLKIDRSFVLDITTDPNDAAIIDAIVAMAKALKLKVVAEGVETQDHIDFLRGLGADQIQGYFFSRPLPAEAMGQLLAEGRRLDGIA
jgi:diguanylate cyclase (GGDEF)-like protein/PAS domain S-box-containing protein